MRYEEKKAILDETIKMLSVVSGFDNLRETCSKIRQDGIFSDKECGKFLEDRILRRNHDRNQDDFLERVDTINDGKKFITEILDRPISDLDRYFALTRYRIKYSSDASMFDKFFAQKEEDNEWAKAFFQKEDGTLKTKQEVFQEIEVLYKKENMEIFDSPNDHFPNRNEQLQYKHDREVKTIAELINEGDISTFNNYDSITEIAFHFKDKLLKKMELFDDSILEILREDEKVSSAIQYRIQQICLPEEQRNKFEFQDKAFNTQFQRVGDRFPSEFESLLRQYTIEQKAANKSTKEVSNTLSSKIKP